MPACTKVSGRKIEQTFAILDVQGVGLKHFTGEIKRLLAKVTSLDQDNYPEMLGHTCIINAPSVFKVIWAFAKPLLDQRTQNKIEVGMCNAPALSGMHDDDSIMYCFVIVLLINRVFAQCSFSLLNTAADVPARLHTSPPALG